MSKKKQAEVEVKDIPYVQWETVSQAGFVYYAKFSLNLNTRVSLRAAFGNEIDRFFGTGHMKMIENAINQVMFGNASAQERILEVHYIDGQHVLNAYCEGKVVGRINVVK